MSSSEKCISLGCGIEAYIKTEVDKACIIFRTRPVTEGFDWKAFLLLFGVEEHAHFRWLLQQFDVSIVLYRGVGYGQSYCIDVEREEDFLKDVSLLVARYFKLNSTGGESGQGEE